MFDILSVCNNFSYQFFKRIRCISIIFARSIHKFLPMEEKTFSKMTINNLEHTNEPAKEDVCPICLEIGMNVRFWGCRRPHKFHHECISRWLNTRPFCPICRRKADVYDLVPYVSILFHITQIYHPKINNLLVNW